MNNFAKTVTINNLEQYIRSVKEAFSEIEITSPKQLFSSNDAERIIIEDIISGLNRKGDSLIQLDAEKKNSIKIKHLQKKLEAKITNPTGFKRRVFFRGHSKDSYSLLPSVMRNSTQYESESYWESYYYRELMTRCAEDFKGKTHLEKLVLMQHYECPTRLLDVTKNPLVALYFACKNNSDHTGEVYIFSPLAEDVLGFDSDRALLLSALVKFSEGEKRQIYNEAINKLCEGKIFSNNCAKVIERLYHEIKSDKPSFEKRMEPIDFLVNRFVEPARDNDRIIKQDGAFILCGLTDSLNNTEKVLNKMVFSVIRINNKERILKELDSIGINEASLFPDIEHTIKYLKEKQKSYMD